MRTTWAVLGRNTTGGSADGFAFSDWSVTASTRLKIESIIVALISTLSNDRVISR